MARRTAKPFRPRPKFAHRDEPVPQATSRARDPIARRKGDRPEARPPRFLVNEPSPHHTLIDSGDGRRLERFGRLSVVRPEGQAIWRPMLEANDWDSADATFTGDTDEEGMGRWRFRREDQGETWPIDMDGLAFSGRFTSFRHVGLFAEQKPLWDEMTAMIAQHREGRARVLNLFGYTGAASLVAARAGAEVTHVDASKKAIGWARENQVSAGLQDAPIRWICEDAMRFIEREMRRERTYDIILADPPAYGRGPNGEVWQLFEDLPHLIDACRTLLEAHGQAFLLTSYAIRASFLTVAELVLDGFRGMGGHVEAGELCIREQSGGRLLSTAHHCVWRARR